jgi:hypothetical protein
MKIILNKIGIQLKILFFTTAFVSLFYVGLLLGEYRTLREYCLVENKKCDISSIVEKGSFITFRNSSSTTDNIKKHFNNSKN